MKSEKVPAICPRCKGNGYFDNNIQCPQCDSQGETLLEKSQTFVNIYGSRESIADMWWQS